MLLTSARKARTELLCWYFKGQSIVERLDEANGVKDLPNLDSSFCHE